MKNFLFALALIATFTTSSLAGALTASANHSSEEESGHHVTNTATTLSDDDEASDEMYQTLISLLNKLLALLKEHRMQAVVEDSHHDEMGLTEIEATIYTNETVVKIELNDKKRVFTTEETDRDALVEEIADRYDLSEADVDDVLEIDEEDRASRASDKDWANDDNDEDDADEDDDDSDEDEDEDEDDDDDHGHH